MQASRHFFLAVAVALHCITTCCGADKPIKIFILAGQSNMVGSGVPSELPTEYQDHPDNVFTPMASGGRRGRSRTELKPFATPARRFGPEVSFAHAMANAWPDQKIVLIKNAIGGTSALAWAPDWRAEGAAVTRNQRNGPLYKNLMEQLVAPVRKRYGGQSEIAGVLWAQGGRDGRFQQAAENYEENLTKIVAAFRKDLDRPDLPFVMAHTVDAPPSRFPHIDKVRAAQQRIAESIPHTALVSIDGLSRKSDRTHFDTKGQLELGRRFAQAYLEMIGEKTKRQDRQ